MLAPLIFIQRKNTEKNVLLKNETKIEGEGTGSKEKCRIFLVLSVFRRNIHRGSHSYS